MYTYKESNLTVLFGRELTLAIRAAPWRLLLGTFVEYTEANSTVTQMPVSGFIQLHEDKKLIHVKPCFLGSFGSLPYSYMIHMLGSSCVTTSSIWGTCISPFREQIN